MKISHQFWRKQYSSFLLALLLFTSVNFFIFCQEKELEKQSFDMQGFEGIVFSLEQLIEKNRSDYQTISNSKPLISLEGVTNLVLTPEFINSIVLFSPPQYIHLINNNECLFYSLLDHGLLFSLENNPTMLPVIWDDNKKTGQIGTISKFLFFEYIYSKKCFANKEIATIFNSTNIATTIEKMNFTIPQKSSECDNIFKGWYGNPYLPGICKVPEIINNSIKYQELLLTVDKKKSELVQYYSTYIKHGQELINNITIFKRSYIENLCSNLDHQEKFCSFYLSDDAWRKVTDGGYPRYMMEYRCKIILKKDKLSDEDLFNCRSMMLKDDYLCSQNGISQFPALVPGPKCQDVSKALTKGQLATDYQDCPGKVDNDSITNINRIILNFTPLKSVSSPESCDGEMQTNFANLLVGTNKSLDESDWPMKMCYPNPVTKEKVCHAYIPGNDNFSNLSEIAVVGKIMQKLKGADPGQKCTYLSSLDYRPLLLEYRHGCFIVFDVNKCTALHCNKKIYYNQKEIKEIKYSGQHQIEYLPTSFINTGKTIFKIMEKPLRVENKSLKNLTEITFFLDQFKKRIIHGVGCLEDLLPTFYKKKALNQCQPIPFIIDGYLLENSNTYMVTRTAIDNVHSPRLILWNNVYNALANYKLIHPVSLWPLYGLKK